ncbi:hypothetical protein IW248_002534 [Micromonospora ureilytica]|uniref:Uncharacterized protein n=1 Tax=Micromonospora ureilytica TaxID=709868 RepID=A0ABS0JHS6_9ACTN|nr:hypothetical protein [Micromonospora ureilytica]
MDESAVARGVQPDAGWNLATAPELITEAVRRLTTAVG